MKCTSPIYALDLGLKENGKRNIKIVPRRVDLSSMKQLSARYGEKNIIPLPCGKCLACRLAHAKEWAVRCVLEAMYHEENYFLTLTYDDDHIGDNKLDRKDLQDFLKRLRKYTDCRYFGCGEYGSRNKRKHYHLILFGLKLDDLKPIGKGLFESKIIDCCWSKGYHYIGEVTYSSCNYVAKYATKKVFNEVKDEFICMSLKPGIGYQWFEDHKDKVLEFDTIYGKFGSSTAVKMPRYFEKIAEVLDSDRLKELKSDRIDISKKFTINEMVIHQIGELEKLYDYKSKVLIDDYVGKKRGQRL